MRDALMAQPDEMPDYRVDPGRVVGGDERQRPVVSVMRLARSG